MTDPIEPREAEAIPVTLERITGMVGGVAKDLVHLIETVTEVRTEVIQHRGTLGVVKSQIQQLQSDARAAAQAVIDATKAREDTAVALEKQTADQVAKAKAAVDQNTVTWLTPMRLTAILGTVFMGLAVIVSVYVATKR
jgi:hypothetical protein